MSTPPAMLNSAAVCTELGIDRSTLSRWVASERITPWDKLPGLRGAYLFTAEEVSRVKAQMADPVADEQARSAAPAADPVERAAATP